MVSQRSFLSVLTIFTFIATTVAQQCYGLDGSALDNTYAPCNPGAKHSGCCATKRTNGSPDICLDNGLCMTTSGEQLGMVWQSGCTDETGKDVACPKMCPDVTNDFNGLKPVSAWQVQTCDYGRYCCRAAGDRRSCCGNSSAPKINTNSIGALLLETRTVATTPATDEPTQAVATAVSTSNPFEATTAPTGDSCQKERKQVAIVGGAIGGLFGATILALAGALYWMYKREHRQRRLKEHYEEQFSQTNAYRKALASTAGSFRGSISMEELRPKSSGLQ
ncbi:hypothetical protein T440DRAFT_385480 [Plenodomus tracheiphilus IPT5]|uniref:Mid2 domain-containing protein n=1 Tax=Plenodomus tracheiphilus IPT5 TaxID=1408161 RepID=A0A6A7BJM6_9PLEO|nr:hypothetical protein T440DRAFT_385480 [Plenodomus tracheiphilus IPT5]